MENGKRQENKITRYHYLLSHGVLHTLPIDSLSALALAFIYFRLFLFIYFLLNIQKGLLPVQKPPALRSASLVWKVSSCIEQCSVLGLAKEQDKEAKKGASSKAT